MTGVAVLCGIGFGLGLTLLIWALGHRSDDEPQRPSARHRLREIDHLGLRCTGALIGAVAIGLATRWPVGVLLAAGGFAAPSLLGAGARRRAAQDHLDAIATWTEQLRDVMAAAAGLEQAIITTAPLAPPAIRPAVMSLASALQSGTSVRVALRRFAERLDDAAGDLVVAALILAAEGSPRQLGELLGRLAATTRETVKMRMRIETGRARTRSSVKVVTTVTVVFSVGIVVLNPTYVEAYQSPLGQLVLVGVAGFFASAFWWLARTGRPTSTARFLTAGAAPARVAAPPERVRP